MNTSDATVSPDTCPPEHLAPAAAAADDAGRTLVLVRDAAGAPIGFATSEHPREVRLLRNGDCVAVGRSKAMTFRYRSFELGLMTKWLTPHLGKKVRVTEARA